MNIAKILKNCPIGTKLYSPIVGEVKLHEVRDSYIEGRYDNKGVSISIVFNEEGKYSNTDNGECLLFPSKEQRDWNEFRLPVKNGDIMMLQDGTRPFIATGETTTVNGKEMVRYHCGLSSVGDLTISDGDCGWTSSFYIPATIRARMALFDAMKREEILFDGEKLIVKKTKVKSKSEKHEFKPFEKVLVRDDKTDTWACTFFSNMIKLGSTECYECCSGILWNYAIPYEGNEKLLGTSANPTTLA